MKAAFTVITPDYVSYAKTLGDSVIKYNRDYIFFICLIGEKDDLNSVLTLGNLTVLESSELEDAVSIQSMQAKYTLFELSCALKPYFAEHILKNKTITRLKYLDSDIMLFNTFDKDLEANTTASIFLTPHFFLPVDPSESSTTNDITLLKSGIFNAGYFEVANTKVASDFLNWWKNRLADYCYYYKSSFPQVFVDQSWLNLVPIYFNETFIVDNLGYNTSFYNLHERRLSVSDGCYFVNQLVPLVFFHFTGYKYYNVEQASIHNPKYTFSNTPFLKSICDDYKNHLLENKVQSTSSLVVNDNPKVSFTNLAKRLFNKFLMKCFKLKLVKAN
jgi:hypothetical protein